MDKTYVDESHCLVAPEIRGEKDHPISCFCRNAIADARYVHSTYLLSGKDRNLNGTFLTLQRNAEAECNQNYDVISQATEAKDWKWDGPEVTRTYPPDSKIEQIKPDSRGFRTVEYKVRLTFRDAQGSIAKVENFTALDRLPQDFKK